jgi:hypothetical protein
LENKAEISLVAAAVMKLTVSEHVEDFGVKEYESKYGTGSKFRNYGTVQLENMRA